MIKYIIFIIFGICVMIAQWLCMTEVDGIRAIYQWPTVSAFISYMNPLSASKDGTAHLVVAVVSRMEHFERRKIIRNTWKKLKTSDTSFFFVMPEQPCHIDPTWRIKESECVHWNVQVLPNFVNEEAYTKPYRTIPTGKKIGSTRQGLPRDGLGFHIRFPLSIEQLGLSRDALGTFYKQINPKGDQNLTVELVDARSEEVIIKSDFNMGDYKNIPCDDGFIYKKVVEESLHKGFEGIVRISPKGNWTQINTNQLTCNIDWNKVFGEDGPIVWSSSFIGQTAKPLLQNFCPLITLIYNIPDLLELKQICIASDTQNKCQVNKNKNILSKLVEEMEDNEDDIFMATELIDSISGATKSVISFLNWLVSPNSLVENFDYVLITDDTSYIALDKVVSRLHRTGSSYIAPIKIWRSFFDYKNPVKHHGSEAVNNFFAPFYPPTPSDAGSVISKQLVMYLTNNMNYMIHGFANVANSLAVWLAPIGPNYYDEPDWFHDVESAYNATEVIGVGNILEQKLMRSLHVNYTQCGKVVC